MEMALAVEKKPADQLSSRKVSPPEAPEGGKGIFSDNLEYLQELEHEGKIRLAIACLRETQGAANSAGPKEKGSDEKEDAGRRKEMNLGFLNLPQGGATLEELERLLEEVVSQNRSRAKNTIRHGLDLPFENICLSYGLDPIERTAVLLLFVSAIWGDFRNLLERCLSEDWRSEGKGLKIGALLKIISRDFREELSSRKYFCAEATLIREEIITHGERVDQATHIPDVVVHLDERIVSFILGDHNLYNFSLRGISRQRRPIEWERVILADPVKEEILQLAENYSRNQSKRAKRDIDRFYGYGTGLAFLFYGPSGTGRTMLAHALAHRLNKDLLILDMAEAMEARSSLDVAVKYIFREAKLSGGMVFFDECGDFFPQNSVQSRALLIEIEKSDCITILATNKTDELDPALDRRITMRVPFYPPDEDQRREIWKASVPPNVVRGKDVDFQALARKWPLTGGLIKNSIFMALQKSIGKNGGSKICLDGSDIDKAAAYQSASMLDLHRLESVYRPKKGIEDVALRPKDRNIFQQVVSVYEKFRHEALGMNFIIGVSDIQTGMDCVEAVAKACDLNVKRYSLFNVIYDQRSSAGRMEFPFSRKRAGLMEQAFKVCPGKQSLTLFVDNESVFHQLLWRDRESPMTELAVFLNRLRSFQGLVFLVTKPIKNLALPGEFHQYIEIKHPPEEIQIRRWETYLNQNGHTERDLVELVERHPMHLHEIDSVARQARISSLLNGGEGVLRLDHIHERISQASRGGETPVLFGPAR